MYENFDKKRADIRKLREYFVAQLEKSGLDYIINGDLSNTLENILSVSFMRVRGEVLLHCLEKYEIYVSTGSACSSKKVGNRVLSAMGLNNDKMQGNIRFSFCEYNTKDEIDKVITALKTEIKNLLG